MPSASVIDAIETLAVNHTTWTVLDIARKYRPDNSGRLRRPRSQRNFAPGWRKTTQQRELIDSIFHNFPLGTAILNKVYDNPDDTDAWFDIYDGRHRIETIWKFVNNEFTYKGLYYRDLTASDRKTFNERKIPVTEITFDTETSTERQSYILAKVFIRLNRGVKLTDSDLCWANRDAPMIRATLEMLDEYADRLRIVFGGCDVHARTDLANWVALVIGFSTHEAANMTTSYLRIADIVFHEPAMSSIRAGFDQIVRIYTSANTEFPVSANALKQYRKIGFVNAFLFADVFRSTDGVEDKWVDIIGKLRDATTSAGMVRALKTTGAQNLNTSKITKVLEQVDNYLAGRIGPVVADSDDYTDDEEN